jgi:hypothetical protein
MEHAVWSPQVGEAPSLARVRAVAASPARMARRSARMFRWCSTPATRRSLRRVNPSVHRAAPRKGSRRRREAPPGVRHRRVSPEPSLHRVRYRPTPASKPTSKRRLVSRHHPPHELHDARGVVRQRAHSRRAKMSRFLPQDRVAVDEVNADRGHVPAGAIGAASPRMYLPPRPCRRSRQRRARSRAPLLRRSRQAHGARRVHFDPGRRRRRVRSYRRSARRGRVWASRPRFFSPSRRGDGSPGAQAAPPR